MLGNKLIQLEKSVERNIIRHTLIGLNNEIDGKNRTMTRAAEGTTRGARDALEAAIYAFADAFGCANYEICQTIWCYENSRNSGNCGPGEDNYLWRAAKAYANSWGNPIEDSEVDGKYYTQNQPNLNTESSQAKINVDYNKSTYFAGPFEISYNAGNTYEQISFTKNLQIDIKDQNGNSITNLKIVDIFGNEFDEVPNREEFFLEFPYTGDVTRIDVNVSMEYISSVYGQSTTWETQVQAWTYVLDEIKSKTMSTAFYHGSSCPDAGLAMIFPGKWLPTHATYCTAPGYGGTTDDTCSPAMGGDGLLSHNMTLKISAKLKLENTYSNAIQKMRKFSGSIEWDSASASMSASTPPEKMEIAGYVWEDGEQGKDSVFNGERDRNDTSLENIEVRLYEYNLETGEATLVEELNETNPVLTDEEGYYSFTGIDPTKKYYVVFTYDGMIYTNTYGAGKPEYNTNDWNASSKGSELVSEREAINTRFGTIGSYPNAYKPSEILFTDIAYLTDGYNQVYNSDDADVLVYKIKIAEQLSSYMSTNKTLSEDRQTYVNAIYKPILDGINNSEEKVKARKILQFIWDCRMNSYSGYESIQDGKELKENELYPYYNKILLTNHEGEKYTSNREENINGFYIIYNGQLNVNQGLVRREQTDLELSEDLVEAIVSINGKDERYKYGTLSEKQINLTTADYLTYTQNIAYSDYNYKLSTAGTLSTSLNEVAEYSEGYAKIQLYITYKINIKNTSNIPTSVDEIVTYFDTQYCSYSDTYTTTQRKDSKWNKSEICCKQYRI